MKKRNKNEIQASHGYATDSVDLEAQKQTGTRIKSVAFGCIIVDQFHRESVRVVDSPPSFFISSVISIPFIQGIGSH